MIERDTGLTRPDVAHYTGGRGRIMDPRPSEDQPLRPEDTPDRLREAASRGQVVDMAQRKREIQVQRGADPAIVDISARIDEHFSQRPDDAEEKARLVRELNHIIDESHVVESGEFPRELLDPASRFRETRERLINRIIFRAFEDPTETRDYRSSMTLYAQSNLDTLLGMLERQDTGRYEYYQGLEPAAQYFHAMNAKLIGGNLQEFMQIAENLSYQHFGLMQKVRGVNEALRIFEEKYAEYLATYTRISPEGYEKLKEDVKKAFTAANDAGLIQSEFTNERTGDKAGKMARWEVERAVNIARTFFNITFRSSELISTGQVPKGTSTHQNRRYSSFPIESGVKIMNWVQWSLDRFTIAGPRGGMEFLNKMKTNFQEFMLDHNKKLGKNRIVNFGGMNTEEVEVGGMFGVSGVYSSWRMEDMAFWTIRLPDGGSVKKWLDDNEKDIKDIQDAYKKARAANNETEVENQQKEYLNKFEPLINNIDVALGVFIKHGMFSGELGYLIRQKLWERVAQNNLPLMVNYLTKLQFGEIKESKTKDNEGRTITKREIVPEGGIDSSPLSFKSLTAGWTEDNLEKFKEKLELANHRRINAYLGKDVSGINIEFTADEQALIDKVKNAGRQLAPHLADIVFPYVPFMNDVPFELLDYTGPGNEFYKRRNGDLVSYNKAETAFISIMNNAGGLPPDEMLKQYDAIVKGIESPQGTPDALERVFPMFKTWFDFIETKPLQRQVLLKAIKAGFRQPTSIAQDWAGREAPSLDEAQIATLVDHAHQIGIVDIALAKELKKKKHAGLLGILWMLFRDYWWIPFVIGGKQFAETTYKAKAA